MTINLNIPNLSELKPRITVFGVGGAGGNAVNNMIESRLEGVEFVVANTDAQALLQNAATRRVQMGGLDSRFSTSMGIQAWVIRTIGVRWSATTVSIPMWQI